MLRKTILCVLGTVVTLCVILTSCTRNVLTLYTTTVTKITGVAALCGGDVTDDNGHSVISKGVCWSTSPKPTIHDNFLAADKAGTGKFSCQLNSLMPNTTYYVRAYATCDKGTEVVFTTLPTENETVTDIDGNVYNTVTFGDQIWMRENLRTTRYADGTPIPDGTPDIAHSDYKPYRYAVAYGNSDVPIEYGLLYNWPAIMHGAAPSKSNPSGVQGICPKGWHVPSIVEWQQMALYVNEQGMAYNNLAYCIAKALAAQTGWTYSMNAGCPGNNPASNNASGFSALPTGLYSSPWGDFKFEGLHDWCYFWTTTNDDNIEPGSTAYTTYFNYDAADFNDNERDYNAQYVSSGCAVRCVKDN